MVIVSIKKYFEKKEKYIHTYIYKDQFTWYNYTNKYRYRYRNSYKYQYKY